MTMSFSVEYRPRHWHTLSNFALCPRSGLKEFTAVDDSTASAEDFEVGTQGAQAIARRITLLLVVAALGGSFALSKLTVFEKYDDEGYLLLSLKHYLNGGHLYTDVFAQYGPFYYFAQWMFFQGLD